MGNALRMLFVLLLCTLLFNVLIVTSTLLLHETGHFLTGLYAGCKNIKLVIFDSVLGTYTEMNCPTEQNVLFPLIGALLITVPYSISFLFLKTFPERNFFWISLGFNFIISMTDVPAITALQIFSFVAGIVLVIFGGVLLIDKLLLFIEKRV
jgi:hypothetical protein